MASKVSGVVEKIKTSGTSHAIASTAYGYCETEAATAAKVVDMTGFELNEGVTIHVKFANANTAASPTLNVNGKGAKPIVQYGTTAVNTANETSGWYAGAVVSFTYDGTSWVRDQGFNTNTWRGIVDNLTSSTNTTQSLSAKQGYLLANGSARDSTKLPLAGGTMTGALKFSGNDSRAITWEDGTWWQRILTTDDSTSGTAVFTFQQTSNSGSTWTDLFTIKDNGTVVATTFSGNASTATKLASNASNTTASFWRGDNTWSSTLTGSLTLYKEGTSANDSPIQLIFTNKDTTTNQSANATISVYNDHASSSCGNNMVINPAGVLILGGGEGPGGLYNAIKSSIGTTEHVYIVSDNSSYIYSNSQTVANRVGILIDTSGNVVPQKAEAVNSNKQNLGASSNKWANVYATNFKGNADSATAFSSNATVKLTGDVTGETSSTKGWTVSTTLANSGVTAGSYGPDANAEPGYGVTFNVPYITVDAKGRVTAASTKTVKIPASDNTNDAVTQTGNTENKEFSILLKNTNDTTDETAGVKYGKTNNKLVTVNPSTGRITAPGGFIGNASTADKILHIKEDQITTTAEGWFTVASYNSPSDTSRQDVMFAIQTRGGSTSPTSCWIYLMLTWNTSTINDAQFFGSNAYVRGVRLTKDDSKSYIEVKFSQQMKSSSVIIVPKSFLSTLANNSYTWYSGALVQSAEGRTIGTEYLHDSGSITVQGSIKASSFKGNATSASAANLTTTANAVAYYTNTTGTFGTKASANGALYATTNNGTLQWGTLPIAQGGTGATDANTAANNLLSGLPDWTANPTDDVKLIRRDTSGSAAFGQIKFSTVWNYIKSKADNVYATQTTVNGLIAAADALVFKGTLSGAATTTYTPTANCGWTYKVDTAGLINGEPVEVGDLLICTTDSTAAATSSNVSTVKANWIIIQNNVDGAVFKSTNAFISGQLLMADGTSGKIKTTNAISGPFAVRTSADSTKAFSIQRTGSSESVAHWVNDNSYFIDYTNDEAASYVKLTLINTDQERAENKGANASTYTYTFDYQGNISGKTFSGNAATATIATNLSAKPVIAAGTSNSNKITVTAGGKTSDEFTVPYATKATNDADGNAINTTYLKKSGGRVTGDITLYVSNSGDTPALVFQREDTIGGSYYDWRIRDCGGKLEFQDIGTHTSNAWTTRLSLYIDTLTGKFSGPLTGNASSATKIYVTNTTPSSTTSYYLTYTNSTTSGNQDLRNSARLYFYDTGTTGYLNVGNASNSGGLTLHNANGKYVDIVTSAFGANRTLTIPNKTGTIALTSDINYPVTGVKGNNETDYRTGNVNITKGNIGLGNVENQALSTWTGTNTITTVGTISTGTWNGTTIAIANGGTGKTTAAEAWTALGGGASGKHADSYFIKAITSVENRLVKFSDTASTVVSSGITVDSSNNITIPGAIYFGSITNESSKAVLIYSSSASNYGIWYHNNTVDKMMFSASNNANSITGADFCINAHGDGTLATRNNRIPHTGNTTGTVGSDSQPVYVNAGTITSINKQKTANALINALDTGSSDLTSNDYVITQYVGGGTTTTTYHRRPASKVINATLVKAALGTVSTTAKKFLKDTGSWTQVDWEDLTGKPSTYPPTIGTTATTAMAGNTVVNKVKTTAKSDNVEYKILMNAASSPTSGSNYEAVYDTNVTINPSTHNITARSYNNGIKISRVKIWDATGPYDEGWKRVCAVSGFDGYAVGTVYINGQWSSEEPTLVAFEITFSHTDYAHIRQTIGARVTTPDEVRLVYSGTGGKWYFDVHIKQRTASSKTGYRYATFVGRLGISETNENNTLLTEEPTTTTVSRKLITTDDQPTITVNLASTTVGSFTGANMTTGISGTLPIGNGGTGATNASDARSNLGCNDAANLTTGTLALARLPSNVLRTYTRSQIGTSPNYDNPGVNGVFEIRNSTEVTGETGTKPVNSFYPMLSVKAENVMFQLAGTNGTGWWIRGKQSAGVTLTDVAWNRIVTNSGTWNISISGNAATANSATTASKAAAANITTTANAIAYYTNTTGTFGYKASANGALYATSANGSLNWGTLPIAQGGTGKTSAQDAANALLSGLPTNWTATPLDDTTLIRCATDNAAAFGRVKFSTIWSYFDGKATSVGFTGTPTAPTAANGTNTTQIATTAFVNNTLSYINAMQFKGTIGTGGTITELPASHNAGDTYRVITAGTYAGKYCEVGTLIICVADGTAAADADWTSVETNEDGAVIGPTSSTGNNIVTFSGNTGRIIQDSSKAFSTATPSSSSTDAQIPTAKAVWAAIDALDGNLNSTTAGSAKTVTEFSQTNGKVSIKFGNISLPVSQLTWGGGVNLKPTATANNQEWSIDLTPGEFTGTYWHVWSAKKSATILACYPDDNHVTMPGNLTATSTTTGTLRVTGGAGFTGTVYAGGFNGPLTGNVTGDVSGNAGTATKLKTQVSLWGNDFDGSSSISNSIYLDTEKSVIFKINRNKTDGGGWAYGPISIKDNAGTTFARIGVFGSAATMAYMYIGAGDYNATNHIRITPTGQLILPNSTTAAYNAANTVALVVGGIQTAQHIEIDKDTILSKTNGTTAGTLKLQTGGGILQIEATTIKFPKLGEGLEFVYDENYFGTNADARIIQIVDTNASGSAVDGGLIIRAIGRSSGSQTGVQELLRIRNHNGSADWKTGEFQWKTKDVVVETGTTKSWNISISGKADTAGTADAITQRASTSNVDRPIWFSYSSDGTTADNGILGKDDSFTYNPSTDILKIGTGTLSATEYSGNAATASSVAWGNVSGKPIEFITNTGALNTNGWKTLGGRSSGKKIAISYNNNAATWNSSTYSATLVYGCQDTKGMLDISYNTPVVTFGGSSVNGSTDNDPAWYMKLSGTNGKTYTFPSDSKTLAATDGSNASGKWSISTSGKADTAGTADIGSTVTVTTHTNTTNGNKTYYMPFLTATSGNLSPHAHSAIYLYETVSNGTISKYDFCFGASAIQGSITLWDGSSHYGNIRTVNLSANRTYDLPNASGTIALTSSNITGKSASADKLNSNTTVSTKSGLQYTVGQLTIGTAEGNAKEGSNNSQALWSYPTGGTAINSNTTANIQNLRLYWGSDGKYFRDIFISPNNSKIYHRAVANGTAGDWRIILDSDNTTAPTSVPVLSWGAESTVFTLNGTAVKIKAMAKPNAADIGAAPSSTVSCTTANVKSALGASSNGSTTKWLNEQGSWSTPTAANVGALASGTVVTNVSYTAASDNNAYPILMKNSTGETTTAAGVKFNKNITINPSTSTITATNFAGNATTANSISVLKSDSFTTSANGWYTIASYNSVSSTTRGSLLFSIQTTGGDMSPGICWIYLILTWSTSSMIDAQFYGSNAYVGGVRLTTDSGKTYVEVKFNSQMKSGSTIKVPKSFLSPMSNGSYTWYSGALAASAEGRTIGTEYLNKASSISVQGSIGAARFYGPLTGNVTGSATALANLYDYDHRPTNANITHIENGGVQYFISKDGTTTNGPGTGNVLHFHWDTASAWDSQLYISDYSNGSLKWRGSSAAGTWGNWTTVLDSANYSSYALPLSGGQMTGPLTWANATALPQKTSANYFLAIDAFADGGKTYFVSKANVLSSIGAAPAVEGGYLPLSGGTMTGGITLASDVSAWNSKGIIFSKGSRIGENTDTSALGIYSTNKIYIRPNSTTSASAVGMLIETSGRASIDTTLTAGGEGNLNGILNLKTSASMSSGWAWGINHLATAMTAGNTCLITGVANTANNAGVLEFHYAGSANNGNYVGLGLFNNNGLLKVFKTGQVSITTNISSTSTSTGSLVVNGGVGIAENVIVGGMLILTRTQAASGTANNGPALIVGGGATSTHLELDCNDIMAKASGTTTAALYLNAGGNAVILGKASNGTTDYVEVRATTAASSTATGALRVGGGVGIGGALYVGSNITVTGDVLPNATNSRFLGSSTLRWKELNLEAQSNAKNNGIIFTNSGGTYGRMGCSTDGIGIYGATKLFFRPSLTSTGAGMELTGSALYPSTNAASTGALDLGTTSSEFKNTYSQKFIVDQHVTMQWNSTDQSLDFIFA